jgi:hypothetical protein
MKCTRRGFTSFHARFIDPGDPGRNTVFTPRNRAAPPQEYDMNVNFDQARIELNHGLFLRLEKSAGATVVCLEGDLWLTRDGSPADVVLKVGQSYALADATRVIVTAFSPSVARVLRPAVVPSRGGAGLHLLTALLNVVRGRVAATRSDGPIAHAH